MTGVNDEENVWAEPWAEPVLRLLPGGCFSILAVLGLQAITAFLLFVVPPILGPVLQAAGIVGVILGCVLIVAPRANRNRWFLLISAIMAGLGCLVGSGSLQVTLASAPQIWGVAIVATAVAVAGTWLVARIGARLGPAWRWSIGVVIVLLAILIPAVIESFHLKDYL